jgi:hypothetical protein
MFRRLALVRTEVSEECIASIIRVKRISGNGGYKFLRKVVLTRATRRHTPEDGILCRHRRENLRSYLNNSRIKNDTKEIVVSLLESRLLTAKN